MKIKIGTQIDAGVYQSLKRAAERERRPIGEVIQTAVSELLDRRRSRRGVGSGLKGFLETPDFVLTGAQFRSSMDADYYEQ
jgi:hypothetical protein